VIADVDEELEAVELGLPVRVIVVLATTGLDSEIGTSDGS